MCTSLMVISFVIYELGLTLFYKWVKRESQEMTIWVVLGSKVIKFIFGVLWIVCVAVLTDEPIVNFALLTLLVLLLTIIYETVFFLKNGKKRDENGKEQL